MPHLHPAFAILALILATATVAAGQDPKMTAADSLLKVALSQARAGDTSKAIKTLERASRIAPRFAPAHFHRGLLISQTTRLGMGDIGRRTEAYRAINLALRLDRDNPFYLLELGRIRLKTPLLRVDAERLFRKAVAAAEQRGDKRVLAEVHTELGQIFDRRYLTMANRHMIVGDIETFDADEALGDWHYTPDFLAQRTQKLQDAGEIDRRKAEEHLRIALSANPAHTTAALSLLGLLYDLERFEEMVLLARETLRHEPRSPRLLMALGLALHRTDRDAEARTVFDSAIALISPDERADMFGLEALLRREAAKSYASLGGGERATLDSTFWATADPLRLTAVNEARIEFLSRVAYADLRFSSAEFGLRGWKTDRGDIHIRYGHPPVVATFAPSDDLGHVTTVWWYPETKLRFVFHGPPAMNSATFSGEFRSYAENVRHNSPVLFDNLRARLRVDSVPVQVARFRGTGRGTEVAIYADIPTGSMLGGLDVAQGALETGLFVTDAYQRPISETRDSAVVRPAGRDRLTPRAWVRELPPGRYAYRVEAREAASGRSARALADLELGAYPAGQLLLSDILVARRIASRSGGATAGTETRSDLLIIPNASLTFAPDDTMHLYWEVYGASRDSSGTAHLEVSVAVNVTEVARAPGLGARVLGGLADAVGMSEKGDDRILLRYAFDRAIADESARIPNHLAIQLDNAVPGTYLLHLTIKDLVSNRTATQARTITIPRP